MEYTDGGGVTILLATKLLSTAAATSPWWRTTSGCSGRKTPRCTTSGCTTSEDGSTFTVEHTDGGGVTISLATILSTTVALATTGLTSSNQNDGGNCCPERLGSAAFISILPLNEVNQA